MLIALLTRIVRRLKGEPSYAFDPTLSSSDVVGMLLKIAAGFARGLAHRPFLRAAAGLQLIGPRVTLRNRAHVSLGRNVVIEEGAEVQGLAREGVVLADNVTVGSKAMIRPSGYYGRGIGVGLFVGARSNIGPFAYIGASGGIRIGADVMMGPGVSMFSENHNFADTEASMRSQGVTWAPIVIEDDCWLAANCIILAGVTIGRGSIIAAGAVVTKDVPPMSIVAGNPARVIRSRHDKIELA